MSSVRADVVALVRRHEQAAPKPLPRLFAATSEGQPKRVSEARRVGDAYEKLLDLHHRNFPPVTVAQRAAESAPLSPLPFDGELKFNESLYDLRERFGPYVADRLEELVEEFKQHNRSAFLPAACSRLMRVGRDFKIDHECVNIQLCFER
jgi:hypothetical protein